MIPKIVIELAYRSSSSLLLRCCTNKLENKSIENVIEKGVKTFLVGYYAYFFETPVTPMTVMCFMTFSTNRSRARSGLESGWLNCENFGTVSKSPVLR